MREAPSRIDRIRDVAGLLIVIAVLGAFLYQLTQCRELPLWLVLLVSVLGLGAGASLLGRKAIETGYAIFKGGSGR